MKQERVIQLTIDNREDFDNRKVSPPKAPKGGERYQVYSLRDHLKIEQFAENWRSFFRPERGNELQANHRRYQRQNGKIAEAEKFRQLQGCFLKTRLHAMDLQRREKTGLSWWFQTNDRVWLHHTVMANYYLHSSPTTEREIMDGCFASEKTMRRILKTAVEIGGLDPDEITGDRRTRTYYPSRGLVADTDAFFSAKVPGSLGVFTYLHELRKKYFEKPYYLDRYLEDVNNFHQLIDELMATSELKKNSKQM